MPATLDSVRTFMGIDPASVVDSEAMQMAVDASNDLIRSLRPDLTMTEPWAARADQAANIEAARLYGRRGSIQGIAAFADIGVSLLPRLDPEVRSLLSLGEYQDSVIA